MDYQSFGKKIRQYRKQEKLTQEQLAEKIDISASFLGHIERGTRVPSIETLISICNALNVSPQALLAADLTSCDPSRIMDIDADQKFKLLHLLALAEKVIAG